MRDYQVISTDDHLQEPRDLWLRRLSKAKWGTKIPEVRRHADGRDGWFIWDEPFIRNGEPMIGAVHGVMTPRRGAKTWDEIPKKAYVPAERVAAMDADGVDVHSFFGNVTGIAGNTFSNPGFADAAFRLDCIRAYNDYQIEEFAEPYPGRFITLANVPMWDIGEAVAEATRAAKRGHKGISFAYPQQFGYPHLCDRHWDPLWAFLQEADLPLNFHIGSGSGMGMSADWFGGNDPKVAGAERSTRAVSANVDVMITILFSGILERFPKLKVVSAESGLCWAPYLLEVADHHWKQAKLAENGRALPPSELFRRQCYATFWFESIGVKIIKDTLGLDNVMWSSDYPHPTGTWPDSRKYIDDAVKTAALTPAEKRKILVDNARKVYRL